jgi:hypothetical protein
MLAYPDPWDSPVGWQLASDQRDLVASTLNSALLEERGFQGRPPLEVALGHAKHLVKFYSHHLQTVQSSIQLVIFRTQFVSGFQMV